MMDVKEHMEIHFSVASFNFVLSAFKKSISPCHIFPTTTISNLVTGPDLKWERLEKI